MSTLDRYLEEREEQSHLEERELQYKENPALDELLEAYETWLLETKRGGPLTYVDALKIVSGLEYTSQDIQEFSIHMGSYQEHSNFHLSGFLLSALINEGEEENYTIITEHMLFPLSLVGSYNKKNITVIGNLGDSTGYNMDGGSIIVNGNVRHRTGFGMEGGLVHVKGDVGQQTGYELEGGSIIVEGNALEGVGWSMNDGNITIHGDAGNAAGHCMRGGKVIIKGNAGKGVGDCMFNGILRVEGSVESIAALWEGGSIYEKGKLIKSRGLRIFYEWMRGGLR